MRTNLPFFVFLLMLSFVSGQVLAQASACPQVNAGPDQTICGGCTTLNATVQGTVGTTSYTGTAIPYNPYPFTGGNPVLVNIDDIWSGVVNLPFCFEFFGNTYNQYVIGANALITFDLTQANQYCQWPINNAIPSNQNPMNSIMAPFHDIDPSVGTPTSATDINWQVYGTAPCREMVINWTDVAMFSCNQMIANSQLVLHESTNIIDIYIQDKPLCSSWNAGAAIEGIQDASGTVAYFVPGRNYPTQWAATNDGYRFMPSGAPNYTVQWLDPSNNVVGTGTSITVCPTQTTTYTAVLTNPTCSTTVVVSDPVDVNISAGSLNVTPASVNPGCGVCTGSATATASGGTPPYTYQWQPSGGTGSTESNLCPGTYTCIVTESGGCQSTVTFNLTAPPAFNTAMSSTTASCGSNNGSATATVAGGTGPFTYSWAPSGGSNATASNLAPGTYTVTIADAGGCTQTSTVTVGNVGMNVASAQTTASCYGVCDGSATVTPSNGTPPYTYQWQPSGGTGVTETGLCSGIYTCVVSDGAGCVTTMTFTIMQPQMLTLTMSGDTSVLEGSSTIISATPSGGTPPYTVTWDNGLANGQSNSVSPSEVTTYNATVTDANGCTATMPVTISIEEASTIYVPNAFTPNNTGNNNMFFAYGSYIREFQMYVFDRWGMLLFESKDINKGWDGTFHGKPIQEDVYVWRIIYTDNQNKRHRLIGHVSLIR
ncbi:MAG: PKD domain-containing protein [Bacteroidetes bacterium]|nr:MAG: PKD domain-containing protein [Bacteroidota bacterium]